MNQKTAERRFFVKFVVLTMFMNFSMFIYYSSQFNGWKEPAMHNPKFREVLGKQFSPLEVWQIINFLERGFSSNGEITVASVFLYAITQGKQFQEILAACEEEWKENWIHQHSDLRGDTSVSGGVRAQNIASFFNIYRKLGISNPGA